MPKILCTLLASIGILTATCAPKKQDTNVPAPGKKILIAYFSATGTTARAAEILAEATQGELYAITPSRPYTDADLDWNDKQSRSSQEMNNPDARPTIRKFPKDMKDYDTVFIGYPIWWNLAPRVIQTFIESHDLKGKKVIPFATSGGSSISNSTEALRKSYPDLDWKEGRLLNRSSKEIIREWIEQSEF